MKTRTLLVDGNYLLKKSYHGAKNVYTSQFGHIGGLYSFLTTIRGLIPKYSINKVVVCWDGENGGVYRYRIDREYKSNRSSKSWYTKISFTQEELEREKEKKQSILKQRKRTQHYCEDLFFRQIEVNDIEGDDIIASYCLRYNNKEELYIYSNDRDFAQLLDLNVSIIFPNISTPVTKSNFYFEFGYHYSNVMTIKIICGDPSDNIKGVGGIQKDTLFKHFPMLKTKKLMVRDVCRMAKTLNEERVKNKQKPLLCLNNLINGGNILRKNYSLVNLREPILNDEAEEEFRQLEMPLSPEDRGIEALFNMMIEDGFLMVYGSNYTDYVAPFYPVIENEKRIYNEYIKKNG